MSIYELYLEDDELFEDDGEADLDELAEDEPEDDLSERRRPGRRPARVRPGKTAQGKGYSRSRPSGRPVSQMQFSAAMERIGRDVRQNSDALKKVSAQINRNNAQLAAANTRQDKEISGLKKEVQGIKKQSEIASMMSFLSPPTLVAADPNATIATASDIATKVKVSPPDILTLMLLGGLGSGSGSGGGGGGDLFSSPVGLLVMKDLFNK
jgi:CRISPR/Cas system CSM-associated protein Csm2 small subunit